MSDHTLLLVVAWCVVFQLVFFILIIIGLASRIQDQERITHFLQKTDNNRFTEHLHLLRQLADLSREVTEHIIKERRDGTARNDSGYSQLVARAAAAGFSQGYERGLQAVRPTPDPDPAGGAGGDLP